MAKKSPTKLHYTIGDLRKDVRLLEDVSHALDDRVDGLAARIESMQINALRQPVVPPQPRLRLLNGSWPLRDGNTYPRFDTTRHKGPVTYYESYVRRSPPATE